jgi:asparagine synthase (glutamine-hydrolysing)
MADALAHRGPDAAGFHADGPVALGHRRLAIIDLSRNADQPILSEDGAVAAVVNGEIYNHRELRQVLESRGHRFRSRSDAEVVVHLYEEHGEELVDLLRGMFAIAVWDRKRKRLVLARDRAGEKPLYFASGRDDFRFASEAVALLASLPETPRADLGALTRYLTLGYVPSPATAFVGIQKLPAAHLLVVEPGQAPTLKRYWRLRYAPRRTPVRERDAIHEVRSLIEEAVRIRQMSDVPMGAFLSGGIDSSTIVSLMARGAGGPLKTFSVGFSEANGESHFARTVAGLVGASHHDMVVDASMVAVLPELVRRYGEPFADSSMVPTFFLAKLAREGVTVALSGDGGDEVFGGYGRYAWDRLARRFAKALGRLAPIATWIGRRAPGARMHLVRSVASHFALPAAERYLYFLAHFNRAEKQGLLGPAFVEATGGKELVPTTFAELMRQSDAEDELNRLLDLDVQTYLPDDIFMKVDVASMAHGLEVRAPLVDHVLMERVATLPGRWKLHGKSGKWLFRRAVSDLVPVEVQRRPKKGFELPIDRWFRGPLRSLARDLLTDATARGRGLFEPRGITRLLEAHQAGARHGERLWNLVVLELWYRTFLD